MIDESAEEFSTLESIQRRVLWLAVRMIDHANKRLISTIDSGNAATPCSDDPSAAGAGIFDLAESFGSGSDKLELLSTPSTRPDDSDGGIRFSFRGFSQNHRSVQRGALNCVFAIVISPVSAAFELFLRSE